MEPTIVWVAGQPTRPVHEFVKMLQAAAYHYTRVLGLVA